MHLLNHIFTVVCFDMIQLLKQNIQEINFLRILRTCQILLILSGSFDENSFTLNSLIFSFKQSLLYMIFSFEKYNSIFTLQQPT
jgi:hypothetical protein